MDAERRPRISEALEELSSYRDDGEEPLENIELVAKFHSIPLPKLRELAEAKWGGPLETDRLRNANHYDLAAKRLTLRVEANVRRAAELKAASEAALTVWNDCCPNGKPDWEYCAKRHLTRAKVEEPSLRAEIADLFKAIGADFEKSVSLYKKWF